MKILIEESVLRQALNYLETAAFRDSDRDEAITALRTALDGAEKAEPVDWDINSMDAAVWAKAFAERFTVWSQAHGVESDTFGLMAGWFANAIMAGYDEATRRHSAPATPEGWKGCGECDCEFPCYEGRTRCIRLAAAPEPKP